MKIFGWLLTSTAKYVSADRFRGSLIKSIVNTTVSCKLLVPWSVCISVIWHLCLVRVDCASCLFRLCGVCLSRGWGDGVVCADFSPATSGHLLQRKTAVEAQRGSTCLWLNTPSCTKQTARFTPCRRQASLTKRWGGTRGRGAEWGVGQTWVLNIVLLSVSISLIRTSSRGLSRPLQIKFCHIFWRSNYQTRFNASALMQLMDPDFLKVLQNRNRFSDL